MAHTYANLLYHIVFSTQGRLPLITDEQRAELHAYLISLLTEKGGKVLVINSMPDHVHVLVALPPNVSLSDVIKFVKANSSRWMKQRFGKPFAWQKGFGAFCVARLNVDFVSKYIREQEAHHRKIDFESEFVSLLEKNGVEYEPKFLWK